MKKYNFNAGPSILPQEVIKQTARQVFPTRYGRSGSPDERASECA